MRTLDVCFHFAFVIRLSYYGNSCSERDDVRNAQWLISRWRGDGEYPGGRNDVRQNHPETDTVNEMLACPMAMVFVPVHITSWFYLISCRATPVRTGSFVRPPCTEQPLRLFYSFQFILTRFHELIIGCW
jgi:hypothetical protein